MEGKEPATWVVHPGPHVGFCLDRHAVYLCHMPTLTSPLGWQIDLSTLCLKAIPTPFLSYTSWVVCAKVVPMISAPSIYTLCNPLPLSVSGTYDTLLCYRIWYS